MAEPRPDMLPDPSLTDQPVIEDPKIEKPVEPVRDEPVQPEAPKGDKTPDNRLYAALQEEKAKRREAEQRLKELESSPVPSEEMSDEGRVLRKQIEALEEKISLGEVINQYPVLKDKLEEFDEFRTDYPRTKLVNVAKLFLAENNLLEDIPNRKGLERPSGGERTAPTTGYSAAEIDSMMKNDNKRFQKLVREGKIDPDQIRP